MKLNSSKIALILLITGLLFSCNSVKRVPEGKRLLTKNTIFVNEKKETSERVTSLLYQRKNRSALGLPIRLYIYNLARPNIDSILNSRLDANPGRREFWESVLSKKQHQNYLQFRHGFNEWLKTTGQAPILVNDDKTAKSENQLMAYYFNNGWFDVEVSSETLEEEDKKASVAYHVNTKEPYIIDSISRKIQSPVVDSLYQLQIGKSYIKKGRRYRTAYFEGEKSRITEQMRNSGIYHFGEDYVFFEMDTVNTNKHVNVEVQISNRQVRKQDSVYRVPFQSYTIKDVNIYTDFQFENQNTQPKDSATYNGINLYSYGKMRFRPKALTNAIFITPGLVYRDIDRSNTYRHLTELRTFKYPNIEYIENPDTTITTNIYLTPKKKFGLNLSAEVSQSNIQTIGLSFSPGLVMRNVFGGAETLEFSAFGSIGSSKDAANDEDRFFDITEVGANLNLTIPRLFFPINTEKLIPKSMFPSTRFTVASSSQTNIGLDKQTFTSALNYKWFPRNIVTNLFDLYNVQYVRNLNPDNYFGVYTNSYESLNDVANNLNYNNGEPLQYPNQTDAFINDVLSGNTTLTPNDNNYQTVSAINERKIRLTENNLIFSTSFNYVKNTKETLYDETFTIFRYKLELAGNTFSLISRLADLKRNSNGRYEIFNVPYSQYAKVELDFIKHWEIGRRKVFAIRTFAGIAIPYGNSNSIPFSKSFYAGGTNDNRAWTAYSLGPGSLDSNEEFNEANLKLAFSAEYRFNVYEGINAALFVDVGNIWNALDNVEDDRATFDGLKSLKDVAVGSGFGIRYDFGFVVARFDIGFKTYDPSLSTNNRWFKDYNFQNAVYNIGINYPF